MPPQRVSDGLESLNRTLQQAMNLVYLSKKSGVDRQRQEYYLALAEDCLTAPAWHLQALGEELNVPRES